VHGALVLAKVEKWEWETVFCGHLQPVIVIIIIIIITKNPLEKLQRATLATKFY